MKTPKQQFGITGRVRVITYKAGTKEILRITLWSKNLIVNSSNRGKNLVAQRLASQNTYTLNINYGEIGTGTTAPAVGDTGLQTAVARALMSSATIGGGLNVVLLRFFFSNTALANGTYKEFGTFIDGTATLGSGQLFNRALLTADYVKATGEDSTFEVEFTIN